VPNKISFALVRNKHPRGNKSIPLAPAAASVSGAVATGRTWAICRAMPCHAMALPMSVGAELGHFVFYIFTFLKENLQHFKY